MEIAYSDLSSLIAAKYKILRNMSIKRALLAAFTIALIFIISTWLIGHLWVFIILVTTALIGIAVTTSFESKSSAEVKKASSDSPNDE